MNYYSLFVYSATILIPIICGHGSAIDPILVVHGGAGTITGERIQLKKDGMVAAIRHAYPILRDTGNVLMAVEEAVKVMEDLAAFNAGYGSVQTETGEIEMDAIIMNGTDLSVGAVGALRHVKNPIMVARLVKDETRHVFLVGEAAEMFAASQGIPLIPTDDLIPPDSSTKGEIGTVGAVAINAQGNIGVATSTGGTSGKMNGRVGDTPIVGAGTFADDTICGVSATGYGEGFIRYRVASNIATEVQNGMNITAAIEKVLAEMTERIPEADGGAIAISKNGEVSYVWNSLQMAWAYGKGETVHFGVNRGEHETAPMEFKGGDGGDDSSFANKLLSFHILSIFYVVFCIQWCY